MSDSTQRFISELIRAANEAERLTLLERANLLRRAAAIVRDYRANLSELGVTVGTATDADDVTREWSEIARLIQMFSAQEVAEALLEAVAVIKACRVLLEERRNVERER